MTPPLTERTEYLMVTVSGPDGPGITAAFSRVLLSHNVEIVDIGQASLQDLLGLSFLLDLSAAGGSKDSVIKDLLFEAHNRGLSLNFRLFSESEVKAFGDRNLYLLTYFGGTRALAALSAVLGEHRANIEMITNLTHHQANCVEMTVNVARVDNLRRLKERIMTVSHELNIDLALQKMEAYRKNKRIIFFDMDSTLIEMEVIDELARLAGVHREVARVTERAMRGDLDFEESLIQRVAFLKGLTLAQLDQVEKSVVLSAGVKEVIAILKSHGYKLAVVTGGFDFFAQALKDRIGLDLAFANRLEIKDGVLTGRVLEPIIDAAQKARIVNQVALDQGILMDQTVVVGDGANDALMIGQAGLGIAYNAKKGLNQVAKSAIGRSHLTNILYLLGITEQEAGLTQG